jgi:hypothetical protein
MEKETSWLNKFKQGVDQFDRELFSQKKLDYKVGIWRESAVLKFQKKSWLNTDQPAKPFGESVFFSIWVSDESIREGKLLYNIHALKLRQLAGYSIKSREFAEAFRSEFKPFQKKWPNISVNFGPLTLMEGWVPLDEENFENIIIDLSYKFLEIAFIIDDLLKKRKKLVGSNRLS